MEYSIVNYSSVPDFDRRLDSEFYKSDNLRLEQLLFKHKSKKLGELCWLHDGPFGSELLSSSYSENGVPALRMQNVTRDGLPYLDNVEFIPEEEADRLIKHIAYAGDVVTTKIGFLGYSTVLPDTFQRYFFRRELTRIEIKDQKTLLPNYLSTFLNTDHGRQQALRYGTGTTRDRVLIVNQRHMLVPIFSYRFQSYIDSIIKTSHSILRQSDKIYETARVLLLSELNLNNWQPKHQLSFIKNHSDIQYADRIDAEYYQPKYDEIIKAIQSYSGGWDTLGNLCELVGHPSNPPYAQSEDDDKTFIVTQKHLGDFTLNDDFWHDDEALYTTEGFVEKNSQYLLKYGDVLLYSVGAYIGKANIYKENIKATIGSFLTLIRTKKEKLNPYYLMAFLNTDAGIAISKQHQRGMAQQYLYPYDIRTFPIPLLPDAKQTQIQQKVTESFTLRKQSKHLLECAKKAVEMAIEQDEETAFKWLESETIELAGIN